MGKIEVGFRFLESGWKYENRLLEEEEVADLLKDATLVDSEFQGWSDSKTLGAFVLKLKDGRKCILTEENTSSYDGGSEGWISIFIDEEWDEIPQQNTG